MPPNVAVPAASFGDKIWRSIQKSFTRFFFLGSKVTTATQTDLFYQQKLTKKRTKRQGKTGQVKPLTSSSPETYYSTGSQVANPPGPSTLAAHQLPLSSDATSTPEYSNEQITLQTEGESFANSSPGFSMLSEMRRGKTDSQPTPPPQIAAESASPPQIAAQPTPPPPRTATGKATELIEFWKRQLSQPQSTTSNPQRIAVSTNHPVAPQGLKINSAAEMTTTTQYPPPSPYSTSAPDMSDASGVSYCETPRRGRTARKLRRRKRLSARPESIVERAIHRYVSPPISKEPTKAAKSLVSLWSKVISDHQLEAMQSDAVLSGRRRIAPKQASLMATQRFRQPMGPAKPEPVIEKPLSQSG